MNAPPTDVRSDKKYSGGADVFWKIYLKVSLYPIQSTWTLQWVRIHWKEMILNCWERWMFERGVCETENPAFFHLAWLQFVAGFQIAQIWFLWRETSRMTSGHFCNRKTLPFHFLRECVFAVAVFILAVITLRRSSKCSFASR